MSLHKEALRSAVEVVGPEKARAWLRLNTKNRPLSKRTVALYAKDMTDGNWALNGAAVVFSTEGRLLDGQHRLQAIVDSGTDIRTLVVRGVDAESFCTIDTGKKRAASQVLGLNGVANASGVASVCRWVLALDLPVPLSRLIFTVAEIEAALAQRPEIARFVAMTKAHRTRVLTAPSVAVLVLANERYPDCDVERFLVQVVGGANLDANDPAYLLRERMLSRGRGVICAPELAAAVTIKAVKAFVENRQVKLLKWSVGEVFPSL